MINEELARVLNDIDCRIYALEQAQMPSNYSLYHTEEPPEKEEKVEPEWTRDQWKSVQQIRAMVLHLNNKVKELQAKKKEEGYKVSLE